MYKESILDAIALVICIAVVVALMCLIINIVLVAPVQFYIATGGVLAMFIIAWAIHRVANWF